MPKYSRQSDFPGDGGFPARSQTFPQAKDKRGEQVAKELASICSNLL